MSCFPQSWCLLSLLLFAGAAAAETPGDGLPRGAVARLGSQHFRHGHSLLYAAFTPDGKRLVTQSADGNFYIWETATGRELHRFQSAVGGHPYDDMVIRVWRANLNPGGQITGQPGVAFSGDGQTLLLVGADRTIRFRDLRTGKEVRRVSPMLRNARALLLAGDGRTLAIVGGQEPTVRLVDLLTGKPISYVAEAPLDPRREDPQFADITAVVFAPEGRTVAIAGRTEIGKGLVRLYDVASGQELPFRAQFDGQVAALHLAPGGQFLLMRHDEQALSLWDIAKGKELRRLEQAGNGQVGVTFSPDGKTLAITLGEMIRLEDALTGKELRQLKGHGGLVTTVAFSPDGRTLASGGTDHTLRLWDLTTGKEVTPTGPGHQGAIVAARCSTQGHLLATVGSDGHIRLWETASGKLLTTIAAPEENKMQLLLHEGAAWQSPALAFGPGDKTLVAAWPHGKLGIWDVHSGKLLLSKPEWGGTATHVALTPDGRLLATAENDGTIKLREASTGKEQLTIRAFHLPMDEEGRYSPHVHFMTFTPDGRSLIARGLEVQRGARREDTQVRAVVRVWETATGKERRPIQLTPATPRSLELSPHQLLRAPGGWVENTLYYPNESPENDISMVRSMAGGRLLGLKVHRELLLWDQLDGREVRRFGTLHDITDFAFSPDGKLLAAGQSDGALSIWDVATGTHHVRANAHRGAIGAVAFTRDGRRLITASRDTTAVLWDPAALLEANRSSIPTAGGKIEELWADLAAADAARAERAILVLAADPVPSVAFLAKGLRPVAARDPAAIDRLIADLDSPRFNVREAALLELERLGPLATAALQKAQASQPGPEMQQRLTTLLEKAQGPVTLPERLREVRALEVLEKIGTAEARRVLQKLAEGAPTAALTQDAKAALQRLGGPEDRP